MRGVQERKHSELTRPYEFNASMTRRSNRHPDEQFTAGHQPEEIRATHFDRMNRKSGRSPYKGIVPIRTHTKLAKSSRALLQERLLNKSDRLQGVRNG
jgi:hypothetical protein